ncbi:MAG: hypothetical protein JXQ90_09150 [Cyclobacteriaceae bacterium]
MMRSVLLLTLVVFAQISIAQTQSVVDDLDVPTIVAQNHFVKYPNCEVDEWSKLIDSKEATTFQAEFTFRKKSMYAYYDKDGKQLSEWIALTHIPKTVNGFIDEQHPKFKLNAYCYVTDYVKEKVFFVARIKSKQTGFEDIFFDEALNNVPTNYGVYALN